MKCPLCNDNLAPVKLSPGTVTHEHQTDCAFVWNDLTVPQIVVLSDAALGRAVRRMVTHPNPVLLRVYGGQWTCEQEEMCEDGMVRGYPMHEHTEDQPEAALRAAGLMEGEGE